MKIYAFLQARSDSTRLPGKVLKEILQKPMIYHQLQRLSLSKKIDKLVLLTSDEKSDDELAKIVQEFGFSVFRGDKDNVLKRFYKCGEFLGLKDDDIIVRLTGDCPLHYHKIVDELIDDFLKSDVDYEANCIDEIYPDGFDAEVFYFEALKRAYYEAHKPSQKEHVTPYIREAGIFKTKNLSKKPIYSNWRLTVDEPQDFEVVKEIFEHFKNQEFSFNDIISYLEKNPHILDINNHINRNEGYLKSLQEDKKENHG